LKTKQLRPQRRLLGGESAVEGDRVSPLESHWLASFLREQPRVHHCTSCYVN